MAEKQEHVWFVAAEPEVIQLCNKLADYDFELLCAGHPRVNGN